MNNLTEIKRRSIIKWTTPVVMSVLIPAHAMISVPIPDVEIPEPQCVAVTPLMVVDVTPKCSGNPSTGIATFQLLAASDVPITIKSINFESSDVNNTMSTLSTAPFTITDTAGEVITWIGPATDALSCLPLSTITITIEFCCDGGETQEASYDLLELLI